MRNSRRSYVSDLSLNVINYYSVERTLFVAGCGYLKHLHCVYHSHSRPSDETTCNTLTFALYEIARNADIQRRLYEEVVEVLAQFSDTDTMEYRLHEQMPYLQAVIKETLRLHAVASHGIFKAGKDNVIPLSKPINTVTGETINSVAIQEGQRVVSVRNSPMNCFFRLTGCAAYIFGWRESITLCVGT